MGRPPMCSVRAAEQISRPNCIRFLRADLASGTARPAGWCPGGRCPPQVHGFDSSRPLLQTSACRSYVSASALCR
jgi:hypothetical protein